MALQTVKPSSPPIKPSSPPSSSSAGEKENEVENSLQKQNQYRRRRPIDDDDEKSKEARLSSQQQQRRTIEESFSDFEILIDCADSPLSRSNVTCLFHTKNKVDTIDKFAHRLSIPDEKRELFIDEIWREKTETNKSLFNGTKFRLSSWQEKKSIAIDGKDRREQKMVELHVGETDYKSFVGTNLAEDWRDLPEKSLANPLGTAVFCICKDGKVLALRRSHNVGEAAGMIVLAGGHPEPQNVQVRKDDELLDVTFELFDSASLELLEETGVEVSQCEKLQFLGLSRRKVNKRACAVFVTKCTMLTSQECIEKYQSQKPLSADESTELLGLTIEELVEATKKGQCPGCHCGAIKLGAKYLSSLSTNRRRYTEEEEEVSRTTTATKKGGLGELKILKTKKITNDSSSNKKAKNNKDDDDSNVKQKLQMEKDEIERARENLRKLAQASKDAKLDEAIAVHERTRQQQKYMAPPPYTDFTFESVRERSLEYAALNPNSGVCGHMPKKDLLARTIGDFPILGKMILEKPSLQKVVATPEGVDYLLKALQFSTVRNERGEDNFALFVTYQDLTGEDDIEKLAEELNEIAIMQTQFRQFKYNDPSNSNEQPRISSAAEEEFYAKERLSKALTQKRSNKALVMTYFRSWIPNLDYYVPFVFMYLWYSISLVPGANLFVLIISFGLLQLAKAKIDGLAGTQSNAFSLVSAEAVEKLGMKEARDATSPRSAMWFHGLLGITLVHYCLFLVPKYSQAYSAVHVGLAIGISCPVFFLLTYVVGPGYVPRVTDTNEKDEWMRNMVRVANTYDVENGNVALKTSEMSQNGRFCNSCHLARPLRSKHCPFCQRCVYKMDHHCPIALTCIGAKNQKWFFFALLTCFIAACTFIRFDWLYINDSFLANRLEKPDEQRLYTWFRTLNESPMSTILFAVQVLGGFGYAGMLLIRQIFCAVSNLTTNEMSNSHRYEYLRMSKDNLAFMNPFDRGLAANFLAFLIEDNGLPDYDGRNVEARKGDEERIAEPKKYSYRWFHQRYPLFCTFHNEAKSLDPDVSACAHGHSHDDQQHHHHHHHHRHSHSHDGGVPCDGNHA